MIENYIILDGIPSKDFEIYVSKSNLFDSASEDIESVAVGGRNGNLHYSNNRYNSFTAEFNCYCKKEMKQNIDAFRNFIQNKKGLIKIQDSFKTTEYRIGRFIDAFSIDETDLSGASFVLRFDCRPERFLNTGDIEATLTASGTITNPSVWESKPMLRITGNGTAIVNGYTIKVNTNQSYVDIDCDAMNCYCGSTNCNNDVTIDEFPVLKSGSNSITLTGIKSIKIKGRWWQL